MKQNKPRKYKTLSQNNAMIASYAISQWEINERKKVRIVDCLPNKFKQDLDGIKYKPDIYYSFVVLSYGASVSFSFSHCEIVSSGTYFRGLRWGSVYLESTQTAPDIHGYMWVIVIYTLRIVLTLKYNSTSNYFMKKDLKSNLVL